MSADRLDMAFVDFFDEQYLAGESSDVATCLMAALAFYHSAYFWNGQLGPLRVCRASKGWQRLAPCRARRPMPHEGMLAVVGAIVAMGDRLPQWSASTATCGRGGGGGAGSPPDSWSRPPPRLSRGSDVGA